MEHLVFVFGTLKEGFPNFATNRGSRIPGEFSTAAAHPLYLIGDRHSPWLIDAPGTGFLVLGQIFRVDSETLAAMDTLERATESDGYHRKVLQVAGVGCTDVLSAFAYLKAPGQLVPSEIRAGPLGEYMHEHARLYRPRH
jgi:gamma-glutamylaminecyclotransferase